MSALSANCIYRFGVFELNLATRQLSRNGREVHLQDQPMRLLLVLLERPNQVRTREELREQLWPNETFVEFDDSLNTAIQKVRQVLGDDARNPRFVETVPRRGYRFIAPVQVELDPISPPEAKLTSVVTESVPVAVKPITPPDRTSRVTQILPVALACLLAGLAAGWFLPHRTPAPSAALLRLSLTPPAGVELRPGIRGGSAISPDGRMVAFVGRRGGKTSLWIRSLSLADTRELPGTEDAILPFWSPDSKSIGFMASGHIRRIDLAGGQPHDVAEVSRPTRGAWTEDGTILFSAGAGGPIYKVRATGGSPAIATPAEAGGALWPYVIYGTDRFLYYSIARKSVEIGSLATTAGHTTLVASDTNAIFVPAHAGQRPQILWMQGTTLVVQSFDPRSGKLTGNVEPVAEGVAFADRWRFVDLSVSNDGVLLQGLGNAAPTRLSWVRRDGTVTSTMTEPDWYATVRLSPDGHKAIMSRALSQRGTTRALWTMDFDRNVLTRLTFEQGSSSWPAWSPDGRQIVYSGERSGRLNLFQRDEAGATAEQRVTTSQFDQYMYDWSRDGRNLVYCEVNPQTKLDLWVLPVGSGQKPFPFLKSGFNEDEPQFSPDSRWISYVSDESGRAEVYVTAFPGPGGKWQVSNGGGTLPKWSPDGESLYYIGADGFLTAVDVTRRSGEFHWSTPRRLFAFPSLATSYDVTPGGERFLVLMPADGSGQNELTVMMNWRRKGLE